MIFYSLYTWDNLYFNLNNLEIKKQNMIRIVEVSLLLSENMKPVAMISVSEQVHLLSNNYA